MKKPIAVIAALVVLITHATAQPLEYKGLRLGAEAATLDPWLGVVGMKCEPAGGLCRALPVEDCANLPRHVANRAALFGECMAAMGKKLTFAGVRTSAPYVSVAAGAVESVTTSFQSDDFAEMLAAVVVKYGEPSASTSPKWQNKAGATFDNRVLVWRRADGLITMTLRGAERDRSTLSMVAAGTEEARESAQKTAAKKAVADM